MVPDGPGLLLRALRTVFGADPTLFGPYSVRLYAFLISASDILVDLEYGLVGCWQGSGGDMVLETDHTRTPRHS